MYGVAAVHWEPAEGATIHGYQVKLERTHCTGTRMETLGDFFTQSFDYQR